ncbi:MAG: hypothetical protein ACLFVJ_03310 [Persicimonas sp.]
MDLFRRQLARLNHFAVSFIVAAAMLGGAASSASAQQKVDSVENTDQSDVKKAEAYYEKGVDAFFNKKYSLAVSYFQRANELDPDAVVVYNISRAHAKLGNPDDALEKALEAQAMGGLPEDTAQKNRHRIVAYRRAVAAQDVCEALNPPVDELDEDSPESSDEGLGVVGWTGVGVGSIGAAGLLGAGMMTFIVSGNLDEYDTARADGDYGRARGLHSDIGDRQEIGRLMLYSGAGLLAAGGAMFAWDYFSGQESAESDAKTAVFSTVDTDGASVQFRLEY